MRTPPPDSVYLLHLLQLGYQFGVKDACPGSEGSAVLARLKGKVEVDLEVGGNGDRPSRHAAGTSFQELHVLSPAFQLVLVGALSDNVVLRVSPSAQLANAVNRTRPYHGQVPTMKVFVIDDFGAGGLYVDRLMEVCSVHPTCKDAGAVLPLGGFQGFGAVAIPSDAVIVEAPSSHHVLDRL